MKSEHEIKTKILEKFDKVAAELCEARTLFEGGAIKESYESLWTVESSCRQLSQTLSWYRCRTPNGRSFSEASPQEVEQLAKLNEIFVDLQNQIRLKVSEIKKDFTAKKDADDPFLSDLEVAFQLGEDDPLYLEDDDNFICILTHPVFDVVDDDCDESDLNFNDMAHGLNHPLHGQHHCFFFHDFLAHTNTSLNLSLDDVLRVAEVWIDVNATGNCYVLIIALKIRNVFVLLVKLMTPYKEKREKFFKKTSHIVIN